MASADPNTPCRISLIHATRGRPEKCLAARTEWLEKADRPDLLEHIFGVDDDDLPVLEATRDYQRVVVPAGGGCVRARNAAAAVSTGDILVEVSDDEGCFRSWDSILRSRTPLDRPVVIAIEDGAGAWVTKTLMNRRRYEQQGYFLRPEFKGLFCDNAHTYEAYRDGVVVEARDLNFPHRHFSRGLAPMDQTYAEENAPERFEEGRATFQKLYPGVPFTL